MIKKVKNGIRKFTITAVGLLGIGTIEAIAQATANNPEPSGFDFEKILQLIVAVLTAVIEFITQRNRKKKNK